MSDQESSPDSFVKTISDPNSFLYADQLSSLPRFKTRHHSYSSDLVNTVAQHDWSRAAFQRMLDHYKFLTVDEWIEVLATLLCRTREDEIDMLLGHLIDVVAGTEEESAEVKRAACAYSDGERSNLLHKVFFGRICASSSIWATTLIDWGVSPVTPNDRSFTPFDMMVNRIFPSLVRNVLSRYSVSLSSRLSFDKKGRTPIQRILFYYANKKDRVDCKGISEILNLCTKKSTDSEFSSICDHDGLNLSDYFLHYDWEDVLDVDTSTWEEPTGLVPLFTD